MGQYFYKPSSLLFINHLRTQNKALLCINTFVTYKHTFRDYVHDVVLNQTLRTTLLILFLYTNLKNEAFIALQSNYL